MSFDTQTKLAMYRHFAETGQRPSLQVVAERVRVDVSSVREAYVRLCAQRVLVLEPDGVSIRMAPPFSGVPRLGFIRHTGSAASPGAGSFPLRAIR
jgi:hypothetical protein